MNTYTYFSSFGEYGGQYDNSTVQRLNCEFMKMGLRGISILLASGDNGMCVYECVCVCVCVWMRDYVLDYVRALCSFVWLTHHPRRGL